MKYIIKQTKVKIKFQRRESNILLRRLQGFSGRFSVTCDSDDS